MPAKYSDTCTGYSGFRDCALLRRQLVKQNEKDALNGITLPFFTGNMGKCFSCSSPCLLTMRTASSDPRSRQPSGHVDRSGNNNVCADCFAKVAGPDRSLIPHASWNETTDRHLPYAVPAKKIDRVLQVLGSHPLVGMYRYVTQNQCLHSNIEISLDRIQTGAQQILTFFTCVFTRLTVFNHCQVIAPSFGKANGLSCS